MSGRDGYTVHVLPVVGHVAEVRVAAEIMPDGRPGLHWTDGSYGPEPRRPRVGDGAYHAVTLFGIGRQGGVFPFALLSPSDCRELAAALEHAAVDLIAAERYARQLPPAEPVTTRGAVNHV